MRLIQKKRDGVLYAMPSGELDQHSALAVRKELDATLSDGGVKRIEFDLSGVTFMDSSGVGVLLGRYRTVAARGGTMGVYGAKGSVEKVLRMSGVYSLTTERSSK